MCITAERAKAIDDAGKIDAIDRAQAAIEFDLDATIIMANRTFHDAKSYAIEELRGRHRSMFVEPDTAASAAYREIWATLKRGQHLSAE